jgi:NMDA receptor-regulated protein 1
MNAAEKKKAKAIARKKKKATEKREAELQAKKEENGNQKSNPKGGKQAVVDEDPLGKEYLKRDPLEEAKKLSAMLTKYAPKNLETWILQFDVASRRKKPLMALRALYKAKAIDPESSELFRRIVEFASAMNTFEMVDAVKSVVSDEAPALWNCKSLISFLDDASTKIKHNALIDLPMRAEVAKALVQTKTGSINDAALLITDGGINSRKVTITSCRFAYSILQSFGDEAEEAVNKWTITVQQRFPYFP